MSDMMRDLNGEAIAQGDKMRDLRVDELEAVSGGLCTCGGPNCDPTQCDKPSPRVP